MKYTSKIFVTVDVILFKEIRTDLEILLIKRKNSPFKDFWALPGGFVDENEDLNDAASRELLEETSISNSSLKQTKAYGKPFRDPRSHTVSVAFYGDVPIEVEGKAADDAKELKWFNIHELPDLAFDHAQIIADAIKIREKRAI